MKSRFSKAQLNAISRGYHEKEVKERKKKLISIGVSEKEALRISAHGNTYWAFMKKISKE